MTTTPKLVFGVASVAEWSTEVMNEVQSILEKHNVKDLDTAHAYPGSEATLKKYDWPSKFTIDSKAPSFKPGDLAKEAILSRMSETLSRLGTSSVSTYYLHAPDKTTPLEATLSAITQLHQEGKFEKFGLSNFSPEDVKRVYDHQQSNGGVLPTVFQGNYNAVSRVIETDLFPLLRKLNISFYAYSPIAGGFLVKNSSTLRSGAGEGRWAKDNFIGDMYNKLYNKSTLLNALDEWDEIAKEEGITKAALAYRWVAFHSALEADHGDAIILGASRPSQLEESLSAIEQGKLSDKAVERIEDVWNKVQHEAPRDNLEAFSNM